MPPPLVVVDGKPTAARWDALIAKRPNRAKQNPWELIASYTDPIGLHTSGLLHRYPDRWVGIYQSVLGMEKKASKMPRAHREYAGLCNLTRSEWETVPHSLPAVWVDLDIREDSPYMVAGRTDYARLEADVLAHAVAHHVPPPTLLLRSGRGLWLFWCVRTDDGGPVLVNAPCPVVAWETLGALHQALQHTMTRIFAPFEPDTQVFDWRRVCRIPGSRHPNGQRVEWTHGPGAPLTLADLAHALRLEPPAPPVRKPRATAPPAADAVPLPGVPFATPKTKTTRRDHSARVRWETQLGYVYTVAAYRGGIRKNRRMKALLVAVACLSRLHTDEATVAAKLQEVNETICTPPLTLGEVRSMASCAVRQREDRNGRGSFMSYRRSRELLAVTDQEQERLGVFPSKPTVNRGANVETQLTLRDALHTLYVVQQRPCPSVRRVVVELEEHGYSSPRTGGRFDRRKVTAVLRELGVVAA